MFFFSEIAWSIELETIPFQLCICTNQNKFFFERPSENKKKRFKFVLNNNEPDVQSKNLSNILQSFLSVFLLKQDFSHI